MNFVLVDEENAWANLLPLTFTRPISSLRVGTCTIAEKWNAALRTQVFQQSKPYLNARFGEFKGDSATYILSGILPTQELVAEIKTLKSGQAIASENRIIAYCGKTWFEHTSAELRRFEGKLNFVSDVWHVFKMCGEGIKDDFSRITKGRKTAPLHSSILVIGNPDQIFLEEGAKAIACTINVTDGPVYLDKDAEIMEGSVVRGPFSLGEHSAVKMGAKIYGPTVIGPHCKVGGEINNSVIFGYSNKAHDGFLGNSVIGEWCNLGADTNNSNLKNNYANVKLYNYPHGKALDTQLQFCGLIMGDHSKSGINTMFNTGTVVGVGCNIFGAGFPPTHIPCFSWCDAGKIEPYKLDKLFETAERVYDRRGLKFDEPEKKVLSAVQEYAH